MPATKDIWSYRPRTGAWWVGGVWAMALGTTAGYGVTAGPGGLLRALPWAVAVMVLAWMVFWLPRVDVDDQGVLVVNPLRTVRVPWGALIDVRTRYSLTLVTPTGQVRAWAAPGPGRHELASSGHQDLAGLPASTYDSKGAVGFGDMLSAPSGVAAAQVRRRWADLVESGAVEQGEAESTPCVSTWHLPLLATVAGGVLLGLVLAQL
ncbi:PH domain-containing protein [Cellulomonas soli]|uniref:PH domain-containing protein n=1 Tax=Cellulomonas soli TaxID=931535 RepID=UPI003F85A2D7